MSSFRQNWPERLGILLVLGVYLSTMAPGLVSTDSGELAAVVARLGLAHPPGYPLYTLLGHAWVKLMGFIPPITAMNLFSCLCLSVSVYVLITLIKEMLCIDFGISKAVARVVALSASLSLAFSSTFWMQAVGNEVYALHILLCLLILKTGMSYYRGARDMNVLLGALLFGGALSHHLSMVVLLPAALGMLWTKGFFRGSDIGRKLILLSPLFLLPILAYSWMYLNASDPGSQQWSVLFSIETLIHHISANQYQIFIVDSVSEGLSNMAFYFRDVLLEFTLFGVLLSLAGGVYLSRERLDLALILGSVFVLNVIMTSAYDIPDVSSYFLLAQVIMAILMSAGLLWIVTRTSVLAGYAHFILPLFLLVGNYELLDHSRYTAIEDNFDQVIGSLPDSSMYWTNEFGIDGSPALYLQDVEGRRKDVIVVDLVSFVSNPGYHHRLRSLYPGFMEKFEDVGEHYTDVLTSWVYDKGVSREEVVGASKNLLLEMLKTHLKDKRVFISQWAFGRYLRPGGAIDILDGFVVVPNGLTYEIVQSFEYSSQDIFPPIPVVQAQWDDRYIELNNEIELGNYDFLNLPKSTLDELRFRQARMMDHRIQYEIKYDSIERAKQIRGELEEHYPKYQLPTEILRSLQ